MKIQLHPHQKEAVDKMHHGCVLWGGGGTGKTITSLAYAQLKENDRQIVVVTTAKVRDSLSWEKEAAKLHIRVEDIQVTSWNKINEFVNHENYFFIFDEQRIVGSGAWVKAFHKIAKKNRWILLSATPGDTWSDYSALFIANGWYKNISEFRKEHAVYSKWTSYPKIERWLNEPKLEAFRKRLLVEMPMLRHTTRHLHFVECEFDADVLEIVRKKRWNVYEDKPIENASELFSVMRKVVSTDGSRSLEMLKLMEQHPRLIVFYNYNYELEILRGLCEEYGQTLSSSTSSTSSTLSRTTSISSTTKNPSDKSSFSESRRENGSAESPTSQMTREELSEWQQRKQQQRSPQPRSPQQSLLRTQLSPKTQELLSRQRHSTRSSSDVLTPEPTARSSETPRDRAAKSTGSSTSSTASRPADAWAGTVYEPGWAPPEGTPDPRRQPRLQRAKSEYEHHQRRNTELWMAKQSISGMSTNSLKSLQTTGDPSSASGTSGSTKTSLSPSGTPSDASFGWAEWNGHKHQDIPDTDRWVYLVQYQSGAEGWNCIETDAMAFWSLTYSWKLYEQAQCRTDRLNTPYKDLHYYIMTAHSPAEDPVMASLAQKKDFQPR